jgi:hypothetical protein
LKQQLLRRIVITSILLALLVLSALPFNALTAKADPIGVGKYLTVEIDGEGYVTATKVKSGDVWEYYKTDIPTEHKLGAGTVLVQAYAGEGWEFAHWKVDLAGTENPVEYKSEKYGYVVAVFTKIIFTITALVSTDAPYGTIQTTGTGLATPIEGGWNVAVEYGGTQTFTFTPDDNNHHVSAIQVDESFAAYTLNYTFNIVQEDHSIVVYFSADGQAYVPVGSNVPVYLGNEVGLTFPSIEASGTATQEEIILLGDLVGTSLILWDVNVGVTFSGTVQVALPYSGGSITNVWTSESLDALYADVDGNGLVDGTDVSLVAIGIKTTVSSGVEYDPQFDINRDGELTEADVHLVNEYKGTVLQSLNFWVEGNSVDGYTLFIETDHFSIFRGR